MAVDILLPKLGFSMNEGTITTWHVADGGDAVKDKPLYTLESEKSTVDVDSPATGRLRILIAPGEAYPVGTLLGVIE